MKKTLADNDIDLFPFFQIIHQNLLKLIIIVLIFVSSALTFYFFSKHEFESTTKIQLISVGEEFKYSNYNSFVKSISSEYKFKDKDDNKNENETKNVVQDKNDFFLIDKNLLHYLFLDELKQNIEKILDQKKIKKLELLPPVKMDNLVKKRTEIRPYWIIKSKTLNKKKFEDLLAQINEETNNAVRLTLIDHFNNKKENVERLNIFKINNIDKKIENEKKDYEQEKLNQITFLREQAIIARELNIRDNTLKFEDITMQTEFTLDRPKRIPYYMMGYLVIEKKIELIENRRNDNAFIENLFDLEKQRRSYLQNEEINSVEKIFLNTPIFKPEEFNAAVINYSSTNYKSLKISLIRLILLASVVGFIFGLTYILIYTSIKDK